MANTAHVQLGITLYTKGDIQEALAEWQQVVEKDPENRQANMYLKMVSAENKDATDQTDN